MLTPLKAQHAETPGKREQKKIGLDKPIVQRRATRRNGGRRIVALEEVAGSNPVGHPRGEPAETGEETLKRRLGT